LGGERIKSPSLMAVSCKTLHVYFPENMEAYEISPNRTDEPYKLEWYVSHFFQRAYKMNQLHFKHLRKKSKRPKRQQK
jgi:hypothetical protein